MRGRASSNGASDRGSGAWRRRFMVIPLVLAAASAGVYFARLHAAPIFLNRDEVFFALDARAIAATGRDTYGRFLPLFFQMNDQRFGSPMWFQPLLMYGIALSLKVLPFSEQAIRVPMAIAGVLDVVLMYFIGALVFETEILAVVAAALVAMTPAHFIFSRVATDYQAPVPFILGWLLSLLLYCRSNNPRHLFVAGVILGIGTFSYIAAYALMPLYLLLTCALLFQKHEPLKRFWTLAAAYATPLACAVPFLLLHPSVVRDVAVRFQRIQPDPSAGLVNLRRFLDAPAIYAGIWNPRLLFIDGPERTMHTTWLAGVFLVALAALLLVGTVRAIRQPLSQRSLLLLGGLLLAPIPASLVGENEAIRRALAMVPFAVLLAVSGLEYLWTAEHGRARRIVFVVLWSIPIALAATYHDYLPHAQAFVRACSVPLLVVGLGVVLRDVTTGRTNPSVVQSASRPVGGSNNSLIGEWFERDGRLRSIVAAIVSIACVQVASLRVPHIADLIAAATVVLIAMAIVRGRLSMGRITTGIVLAVLSSEFLNVYVDYTARRLGPVPASLVLAGLRSIVAAAVLAAAATVAASVRRPNIGPPRDDAVGPILWLACLQLAYFFIDRFTNSSLRLVHSALVLIAGVGLAAALSKSSDRLRIARLSTAALTVVACLQFGYFVADYLNDFQVRGSGSLEGNIGLAFEAVVARAQHADVPAIQLARMTQGTDLGEEYWKVYLIKHHREDLLARTKTGPYQAFDAEVVRRLPAGSLVVARPSSENDRAIDGMVTAGELTKDLVKAPDGTPIFWVLQTADASRAHGQ
jgi:4-amino-4-deoxy-L-arabinose transferase-like glycosyltransferase